MHKFLTALVLLFIGMLAIGTLVPTRSAEERSQKRWAFDHAMCEWKANILHTTPEIYEYTRSFWPNIRRYVACMVENGHSTEGPHPSSRTR